MAIHKGNLKLISTYSKNVLTMPFKTDFLNIYIEIFIRNSNNFIQIYINKSISNCMVKFSRFIKTSPIMMYYYTFIIFSE